MYQKTDTGSNSWHLYNSIIEKSHAAKKNTSTRFFDHLYVFHRSVFLQNENIKEKKQTLKFRLQDAPATAVCFNRTKTHSHLQCNTVVFLAFRAERVSVRRCQ